MNVRPREALAAAAALGFAAFSALQPLRSFDLFWHLATGRYIVEQGALPRVDPFRFTSHAAPWVDHSWLAQLGLFATERWLGLGGLVAVGTLSAVAIAAVVVASARRRGAGVEIAALIAVVAIFGARPRLMVRPELASLLGLTVLLAWLQRHRDDLSWRRVGWMALAVVIWANLHPGVIVAPVVAFAFLLGRLATSSRGRSRALALRDAVVVPAIFAGAILVNPAGASLLMVPLRIRAALDGLPIVNPEWMRAWDGPWPALAWGGAGLAAIVVAAAWRRRFDPPTLLVAAGLAALAIDSIRNQGLFFVGAAFAAAEAARAWAWDRPVERRIATGALVLVTAAFALWCLAPPGGGPLRPRQAQPLVGVGLEPGLFPVQATELLRARPDFGALYNDAAFGGYVIWQLYPGRQVFLDGRNEVDPGFLQRVARSRSSEVAWTELLDETAIDAALVQYRADRWRVVNPAGTASMPETAERTASQVHFPLDRFALIQWDDAGMFFLRRTPERAAWLGRDEFRFVHPEDPQAAVDAARRSDDARRLILTELDRRDRAYGPCARSSAIRAEVERASGAAAGAGRTFEDSDGKRSRSRGGLARRASAAGGG